MKKLISEIEKNQRRYIGNVSSFYHSPSDKRKTIIIELRHWLLNYISYEEVLKLENSGYCNYLFLRTSKKNINYNGKKYLNF